MKGSDKKRRIEQEKKKETAIGFAVVILIVIVLGGAAWYFIAPSILNPGPSTTSPSTDPTLTTCINEASLAMHIHVQLSIIINGQPMQVPANVGIDATCTRPVHTHDDTGEIHIESPASYPFTLGDFFLVWGHPFDNTQVITYKVNSSHTLKMTVNGITNNQFQNYVFQDGDQIQITYGAS